MKLGLDDHGLRLTAQDVFEAGVARGIVIDLPQAAHIVEHTQGWPLLAGFMLRVNDESTVNAIGHVRSRGIGAIVEPLLRSLTELQREAMMTLAFLGKTTADDLRIAGLRQAVSQIEELVESGVPILRSVYGDIQLHDVFRQYLLTVYAHDNNEVGSKVATSLLRRGRTEQALAASMLLDDMELIVRSIEGIGKGLLSGHQPSPLIADAVRHVRQNGEDSALLIALDAVHETWAGNIERAKRLYRRAIALDNGEVRAWSLVNLLTVCGNSDEPLDANDAIIFDEVMQYAGGRLRCELLAMHASHAVLMGDNQRAVRDIEDTIREPFMVDNESDGHLRILTRLAGAFYIMDRVQDARKLAEEALLIADHKQMSIRSVGVVNFLIYILRLASDDLSCAIDDSLSRALDAATKAADQSLLATVYAGMWLRACEQGDLVKAESIGIECKRARGASSSAMTAMRLSEGLMNALCGRHPDAIRALSKSDDDPWHLASDLERSGLLSLMYAEIGDQQKARNTANQTTSAIVRSERGLIGNAANRRSLGAAALYCLAVAVKYDDLRSIPRLSNVVGSIGYPSFSRLAKRVVDMQIAGPEPGDPDYELRGLWRIIRRVLVERSASPLTAAERRVLAFLAKGKSTKEIASELDRSPRTVENQMGSIARKLNARGRLEILLRARDAGILEEV